MGKLHVNQIVCFLVGLTFSINLNGQAKLPHFLLPTFEKGIILMKDGRKLTTLINYNIVENELIVEQNGNYYALEKPEEIDTIYLGKGKFILADKYWCEVITSGPLSMLAQTVGHYTQAGSTTAYGMTSQTLGPTKVISIQSSGLSRTIELPDNMKVSTETIFWIKIKDEFVKFRNAKQLLKLFPGKEAIIRDFIKKNRIDLKVKEDVFKLGTFLSKTVPG